MKKPIERRPPSKIEKKFNYAVAMLAKGAALVLGAGSVAGHATNVLDLEASFWLLSLAFLILVLASLQDSSAIHREIEEELAQRAIDQKTMEKLKMRITAIERDTEDAGKREG